jgi:hypothetical protein
MEKLNIKKQVSGTLEEVVKNGALFVGGLPKDRRKTMAGALAQIARTPHIENVVMMRVSLKKRDSRKIEGKPLRV